MKYLVVYKYDASSSYIIGFTDSLDNFLANNARKSYPYNYEKDKIKLVELHEDVFSLARIEGQTNFQDYLRG